MRQRLPDRGVTVRVLVCGLLCCIAGSLARAQTPVAGPVAPRPRIGLALGGGSARGLAHVGVIRWFEEHHIPIDLVAGTSMGGLVGGAFATGMSSRELGQMLQAVNWDEMFGSSPFLYKNVRRKEDARQYPSRIEFGLRHGLMPPLALNNGQQVNFMLARLASPYGSAMPFDELPTPFRCVAVDLVSARPIVLDHGSLADAMRATMSLPGIFPPIEIDGRVLVDGGVMNNVPADVVRAMGANVVIAVNVGDMSDTRAVSSSFLGLMGQAVDVMMLANTRAAMRAADIIINPPLEGFGSLDWRHSEALAHEGYAAAEALRAQLLPLALDDAGWTAYLALRQARRQSHLPTPQFLEIVGAAPGDQRRMEEVLAPHVDRPLDIHALETELTTFTGLDRYETVDWQFVERQQRTGLQIRARPKSYAPPFLMLGVNLQNVTSDDFAVQIAARYLTFDRVGSGSELRVDGAMGVQPRLAAELYRPIGRSPFFFAASAGVARQSLNFIRDDSIVAQYDETRTSIGLDLGVNLGRDDDIRVGVTTGSLNTAIAAGDPSLPEVDGGEMRARVRWLHDGQDHPVVPSRGVRAQAIVSHIFESPELPAAAQTERANKDLTQGEIDVSAFWSLRRRDRLFLLGAFGTSFGGHPLATEQFQLGRPLHLGAYDLGEVRGDHYGLLTVGYLRGVGRLPDLLGGPIFVGTWLENGAAFETLDTATLRTNTSVGAVIDTLVGPMILGASFSFDGSRRYYVGIGRIFSRGT
jgi:NTE family protein